MSYINVNDWKKRLDWKFPYRDYGLYGTLTDPEYIKSKNKIFAKNGNGWWWGDGWWNGCDETPMAYHRRKRKERGL